LRASSRSQGVAGKGYFLVTWAPSRVFQISLKEGWKKFTYSRADAYNLFRTAADSAPSSLP